MTEEFLYEREQDLLDYIRSNLKDPKTDRGQNKTATFSVTSDQVTSKKFRINDISVKNIIEVTFNTDKIRPGYDYTIIYGEDGGDSPFDKTAVTLTDNISPAESDAIVIKYHRGESHIYEDFNVDNAKLPFCVLGQLNSDPETTGIGEETENGKSVHLITQFVFETRARYKRQCVVLANKAINLISRYRHSNAYRQLYIRFSSFSKYEYDKEKEAYIIQFEIEAKWEIPFV